MLTLGCKLTAKGGSVLSWAEAYDKAYDLVSQMTLVEKGPSPHYIICKHPKLKTLTWANNSEHYYRHWLGNGFLRW